MTTSRVACTACEQAAEGYNWGFALLAGADWWLVGGREEPRWICPQCQPTTTLPEALDQGARNEAGKEASLEQRDSTARTVSVLLVDDEQLVRRMTARILGDFKVVQASSGAEALELLSVRDFDVIVSDVVMPGLHGPAFYEAACQRWPALTNRFVFVSGNVFRARAELDTVVRRLGLAESPPLIDKLRSVSDLVPVVRRVARPPAARSGVHCISVPDELRYSSGG